MRIEDNVQLAVAKYIRLAYPFVVFTSDASGIRLPIGYAKKLKGMRSKHKIPDMIICYPSNGFHGLFLELKKDRDEYMKKDGTLRQDSHTVEQAETLAILRSFGYKAEFAGGFDEARLIIDKYISNGK